MFDYFPIFTTFSYIKRTVKDVMETAERDRDRDRQTETEGETQREIHICISLYIYTNRQITETKTVRQRHTYTRTQTSHREWYQPPTRGGGAVACKVHFSSSRTHNAHKGIDPLLAKARCQATPATTTGHYKRLCMCASVCVCLPARVCVCVSVCVNMSP